MLTSEDSGESPTNIPLLSKGGKGVQQQVINEKLGRCREFKNLPKEEISPCYTENTPKEELVLEHVIQFENQFHQIHDDREIFIIPENECGSSKFICTTIRPTKLGYLELYDYMQCARSVANYITFEELDPPNKFPSIIPSPANVIQWQKGDSFDISIVLASFLIGVGYDAYCVYGRAPREVTIKNEALMENPLRNKGKLQEEIRVNDYFEKFSKENEFAITKREDIISKFDKKHQDFIFQKEQIKNKRVMTIDDDEPDPLQHDEFLGRRVHCWVLLKKGKRGVEENMFIEPATGRLYEIKQNYFKLYINSSEFAPYLMVDAIFNHQNFWINLKQELPVYQVPYDDMNILFEGINVDQLMWEYVMLDGIYPQKKQEGEEEDMEDRDEELSPEKENMDQLEIDKLQQQKAELGILDMPPSWSPKPFIDKEKFAQLSLMGEATCFYKKSKVDTYAPYSQKKDGLIQKLTFYEDYRRVRIKEARLFYQHRRDKLILRRRYPFDFKTIEEYDPGNQFHWKQVIEISSRLRIIKYYHNRNNDGLIMREERIGQKTIEYYEGRDDKVVYRSMKFDSANPKGVQLDDKNVIKMTQKFDKNELMAAHEQIDKMIIDFVKNKVFVFYHMEEGDISPRMKIFERSGMLGLTKSSDAKDKKHDDPLTQYENNKMITLEKEFQQAMRSAETIARQELNAIRDSPVELEETLYLKAREKSKQAALKKEDEQREEEKKNDFLYPFLEKKGCLDRALSKQEAQDIKNEVLTKLRTRLLSRVDIIQKRLEEERHKLELEQQKINKKGDSKEEEKSNQIINELNFKINILDQRAQRFELMALKKYKEMDQKLNEDARLEILHKR